MFWRVSDCKFHHSFLLQHSPVIPEVKMNSSTSSCTKQHHDQKKRGKKAHTHTKKKQPKTLKSSPEISIEIDREVHSKLASSSGTYQDKDNHQEYLY